MLTASCGSLLHWLKRLFDFRHVAAWWPAFHPSLPAQATADLWQIVFCIS